MTAVSSVNYQTAIVASNVSTIEEARVVGLLAVHSNLKDYPKQCAFVESILKAHCTAQDVIAVEDSSQKPKDALLKKQIPNLNPNDYNIEGWDDPEACQQIVEHIELRSKIRQAINDEDMPTMQAFIAPTPPPFQMDRNNLEHLKIACELQLTNSEIALTQNTFPQIQRSLNNRTAQLLDKFEGKLFILMGPLHANKEWLASLKVNYIILKG